MNDEALSSDIRKALKLYVSDDVADDLTSAIVCDAISDDGNSREVLAVDPSSNKILQIDIPKAALAAAGVLGAAVPLLKGQLGIESIMAALAAVGALRGLTTQLPAPCAEVVLLLLTKKEMVREELTQTLTTATGDSATLSQADVDRALEMLEQIGSIRTKGATVKLVERVLLRW